MNDPNDAPMWVGFYMIHGGKYEVQYMGPQEGAMTWATAFKTRHPNLTPFVAEIKPPYYLVEEIQAPILELKES